jgi:DNA-binding CsgD family transcriptional regulator/PAS domain-containing protein
MNQDDLLSLIDGIYGAAADGACWPAVLQRIADAFGAGEASLSAVSATTVPWLVAPRSDPKFLESYGAYYHPLNLFWQRSSRLPVGTVATDAMIMPRNVLQASEFYNDWSRPQGYLSVMGATLLVEDGWRVEFVVPGKRAFGPHQIKLYRAIAPHLTRAVQLAHRFGRMEMERAAAADALDRLSQSLLVVNSESRVLFANRAANAMFGNGLSLHDGILRAGVNGETTELHRMVAGCARDSLVNAGGHIAISRGPGRLTLSLLVIPAKSQPGWLAGQDPCAMIFATDPETIATPETVFLQKQFGLTPAEAALARELLSGDGVDAAAKRLGIAMPTARTQLRSVLAKTGASRQAELVRLILHSDNRLRRD